MRNSVVIEVSKFDSNIVVHFCNPAIRKNVKQVEMQLNKTTSIMVDEPSKLQGNDRNLFFPLMVTQEIDKVDFQEIERIMCINGIAHNVTSIAIKNKNTDCVTYDVVYNEY